MPVFLYNIYFLTKHIDKCIFCDIYKNMSMINDFYEDTMDKICFSREYVRKLPYIMGFKTTHWCWYSCAHCLESCGPNMPKEYIPADVIKGYINQAIKDPKFGKELIFTGGEIFSAYYNHDTKYVKELLDCGLSHGCGVDIKTNAGWATKTNKYREQIICDLADVLTRYSPGKINVSPLQISLSLDRYHADCINKNAQLISDLSRAQSNSTCMIHISTFDKDMPMFAELIKKLNKDGNRITELELVGGGNQIFYAINDRVLVYCSSAQLNKHGRANNLEDAVPVETPQFKFLTRDKRPQIIMAFDSFGNVMLGENTGRKIHAPWRDKNKNPRDLPAIRRDLVRSAQYEDLRLYIRNLVPGLSK